MTITGLDSVSEVLPPALMGKRVGVLCHSPSITSDFRHITRVFYLEDKCKLTAVFGPQHGIHGETQDNMIEWDGYVHPVYKIPVYSLYGEHRKPVPGMLKDIDVLVIDLQDIGARLYTYIWTVKLCMEACTENDIPVVILDRPNPIGYLPYDGPVLKEEFFSFVGGASFPMCHRMTIGEMALWIMENYYPKCDLKIIWMKNWKRSWMYHETGLPWVIPSPNMPTIQTATVYPGTVLFEALNISEGRGTTIPFELFGAPFLDSERLKNELDRRKLPGSVFRMHSFIPTFNKYSGQLCNGIQIHVTDLEKFKPVSTALEVIDAIIEITGESSQLIFNPPPYEYENVLMPFDILSGDSGMRKCLTERGNLDIEKQRWAEETEVFRKEFASFSAYPG